MYPTIEILGLKIFTFGILLSITWLIFVTLLHHFAWKKWFTRSIFSDRTIIYFTLSMFLFARIFYVFTEWRDEQFIIRKLFDGKIFEFLKLFFTPENYHFSLFGWIFWFFLIFFWSTRNIKRDRLRYFDALTLAFLYSSLLGYLATLLWGQIYGIPFDSFFSITYTHRGSIVWLRSAVFPLPIFYMISIAILIYGLTRFEKKIGELPDGFMGYLSLWLFSGMIFLWEFLNGSDDMFQSLFYLNLNQIGAIIGIILSLLWIFRNIEKTI